MNSKRPKKEYEANPFEDELVASEWINSIENEKGRTRDNELYPELERWAKELKPNILVDIGAGQGVCADHVQFGATKYVGIEPSPYLIDRGLEIYPRKDRDFILGNAYEIPLQDNYADAVLSVNVWFHLENLSRASAELARILKSGGSFLISTANPEAYNTWRGWYFEAIEDDKKIDGKVHVPINPLSRNIFYKHSMNDILENLRNNNLKVEKTYQFSFNPEYKKDVKFFISFYGKKI